MSVILLAEQINGYLTAQNVVQTCFSFIPVPLFCVLVIQCWLDSTVTVVEVDVCFLVCLFSCFICVSGSDHNEA